MSRPTTITRIPPARARSRGAGFTLVEVMVAIVVMGLLAGAVTFTFAEPIRRANAREAVQRFRGADAATRLFTRRFGAPAQLVLDVDAGTIERRENGRPDSGPKATLPSGCRIAQVRIGGVAPQEGRVLIDVSPLGASPTYAVQIAGPEFEQWLLVAGLTGEVTVLRNANEVNTIFSSLAARGDRAWTATGDDAD